MTFSIIVPVYNVEEYIAGCLQSVIKQDFEKQDFEIVVVNDCTPDCSMAIVEQLALKYSNIRIINHSLNKHLGGARNTGIKSAKGDWLFFLDSDDQWESPNVLKEFKSIIDKFALCSGYIKSLTYSSLGAGCANAFTNTVQCAGSEFLSMDSFFCNVWTGCYNRRFLIDNNLYFREHVAYEDMDWSVKCAHHAKNVVLLDYPFYGYRTNQNSITNNPKPQTFSDNVASFLATYDYVRNNIDQPCRKHAYNYLKKSVLSFVRYSRNFKVQQSCACIVPLLTSKALHDAEFKFKNRELPIVLALSHCPKLTFIIVRFSVLFKRSIKSLFK